VTLESDVARDPPTVPVQPSGTPVPESLGPISPELVLVDPVLAEQARDLLSERREPTRPRRPPREAEPDHGALQLPSARAPRRWRRTAALAALVFIAGAASGQYLVKRESSSPASLEVRPVTLSTEERERDSQAKREPEHRSAAPATRKSRRTTAATWAANVLGVTVDVSHKGVSLVWKRPSRSDHVVVVRSRNPGTKGVVVFRGRATAYRDATARSCREYQYTIVNYDRRGRRSTGVLTSVVTPGCT
jgi:hypothetical protein